MVKASCRPGGVAWTSHRLVNKGQFPWGLIAELPFDVIAVLE